MKRTYLLLGILVLLLGSCKNQSKQEGLSLSKPNVLFIAIDDLNDWVGPLDGHPQVLTPNLDRFCNEGAMVFRNAVCAAPICGPSRSALLSGFMPHRTGVYGNDTNMLYSDLVKEHATLPEYFSKHAYHSLANGKIFHKHATEHGVDFGHWAFDTFERSRRYVPNNADPLHLTSAKGVINGESKAGYKGEGSKLRWGPTKCDFEGMVDYKVADWAREQLKREWDQPFFLAAGFIKPHLSWFVPAEFFEMYDLDSIELPDIFEQDLEDIRNPDGSQLHQASDDYKWIREQGLEKEATRAYMASITFVDACLGIILDALEESGLADNTIIVIWGDHGYHLGEKLRYLKNTLWAESAKTPFIVSLPGMDEAVYCDRTVSLIDIYPTLIKLCGLAEKELDGLDFSSLLSDPDAEWERPGITVSSQGTSVMGERWHFISNLSGAEELYDLEKDPMEWKNLVHQPDYEEIAGEMRKWVPELREESRGITHKKPPKYVDADADPTLKPARDLNVLK